MKRKAPTFKVETVTPAIAEKWLALNRKNRPLSKSTAKTYAAEIKRGEWMMNAEAIKFDWNGKLVDGQHRLSAVVLAGRSIDVLVARNLDPEAFKTIDTGRARGGADILALRGVRYQFAIGAAYRQLHRYLLARHRAKIRISNTQLLELVDAHPKLIERAYECMQKPLHTTLITASTRIFWYYLACSVDARAATAYMSGVAGHDLKATTVASRLRKRLMDTDREVIKPSVGVKYAWLVDGWNHHLAGTTPVRFPRFYDEPPEFNPRPSLRKVA